MSVTSLTYNSSEKQIEGSIKVFTNDLEDALRRLGKGKVDLLNSAGDSATIALLDTYLAKRLRVSVNHKSPSPFRLLGFENQEEATWIHIYSRSASRPASIRITNTVLYDFLAQQMNIVQVKVGDSEQNGRVINPESQLDFDF